MLLLNLLITPSSAEATAERAAMDVQKFCLKHDYGSHGCHNSQAVWFRTRQAPLGGRRRGGRRNGEPNKRRITDESEGEEPHQQKKPLPSNGASAAE